MNFDSKLLKRLREYLQLSESYVAQELGISKQYLQDVESDLQPIPKVLIEYYAQSLSVRPSYLHAVLSSSKCNASTRPVNKALNKYFGLIQKLKKHEEK